MNAGFPELREQLTAPAQLLPAGAEQYKVYYDGNSGAFLIPNARRSWVRGSEQAVRQFLQAEHGVSSDRGNEIVSPIVRTLVEIRRDLSVSYAGKLAGHMAGLVEQNGELILVTDSPRLIEPSVGGFPIIEKFLNGLLEDQRIYFDCWMKIGVESLRSRLIRPGQAIVLAGPKNCGKSVLQNQVITPALGGRSAKPYQFMSGATAFNGNLFEAEHLMIEDDVGSFDIRARRHFGAYLKQFTANEGVQHHAKNRQGMTLKPFWRVSISCNDEPESLMILPPIDESLSDKVIIFQAKKKPMPMPTQTDEERAAFQTKLRTELPAYLGYLLKMQIPEKFRSPRYGVETYHNPEVLKAMNEIAPEFQLLELIDQHFNDSKKPWKGKSSELEAELTGQDSNVCSQARKLLHAPNACGWYLTRLEVKASHRVKSSMNNGTKRYTILFP